MSSPEPSTPTPQPSASSRTEPSQERRQRAEAALAAAIAATSGRGAPAQDLTATGAAAGAAELDAESTARSIALRLLNHSPRSRAQLAEAMARKDIPEAVAQRVLDRFEEVGLVDDAEYAAMLVRTRQSERGLARRALAVELKRKGIDAETAAAALQQVDADDELAAARRLVDKRLRSMTGVETEVKRRRLMAMLARKGHPAGVSYRVVAEALDGC